MIYRNAFLYIPVAAGLSFRKLQFRFDREYTKTVKSSTLPVLRKRVPSGSLPLWYHYQRESSLPRRPANGGWTRVNDDDGWVCYGARPTKGKERQRKVYLMKGSSYHKKVGKKTCQPNIVKSVKDNGDGWCIGPDLIMRDRK